MRFIAALQFLTIIRSPWQHKIRPEEAARSIAYFPAVGIIIGLILAGLNWALGLLLPSAVVSILLIVVLVVITGGTHLDGFIDTCDGIGGHKTPEERWQVMHDSRSGSFGIIGVCCLLLAKYISLNSIPDSLLMTTLVIMPVVSRWAMVYTIFAHPYARPSGLGKSFKHEASGRKLAVATAITLAIAIGLGRLAGLAIMLGTWIVVIVMATYLKRKFAGLTGDTYGAINEVAEVSVLILVSLLAHQHWLI